MQQESRLFNRVLNSRRVYVEHVINYLKMYRVIGGLYVHQNRRPQLNKVVELCAGLAQRRVDNVRRLLK